MEKYRESMSIGEIELEVTILGEKVSHLRSVWSNSFENFEQAKKEYIASKNNLENAKEELNRCIRKCKEMESKKNQLGNDSFSKKEDYLNKLKESNSLNEFLENKIIKTDKD